MPDTTLTSAIDQLQNHQTQLDMDGVAVGVSRQALDIVLDALARAGLEAGKAEEWLPIETAPTDRGMDADFLLWDGRAYHIADVWWFDDDDGKVPAWFNGEYRVNATHWMELPEPPTDTPTI